MMTIVWFLVYLLFLAGALWVLAKILDLFIDSGLPPALKPIILGLVGLVGAIFVIHLLRGGVAF